MSAERKRCPKCNSATVKKVDDRSKPLSHFGGLGVQSYKKVWKCGDCGEIFE
ncbi:MAG: hypothetical protein ACXACI_08455 [Candidatus Hodarchaeales archaeon]